MNVSRTIISAAVALTIGGAVSLVYAQSNQENINIKYPNNLTQTQSDAALPCQPGPFNPHLPRDAKSTTNSVSADCQTVSATTVQVDAPAAAPVVVQSDATPRVQAEPQPEPVAVASNAQYDDSAMTTERMARADRN